MSNTKENQQVMRSASVVLGATLLSRILGAIRDPVVAALFSVGATDAFYVAFTIPNALRVLLGEGATSAAVIPVLVKIREHEGTERAQTFFRNLFAAALRVVIIVTIIGIVCAPWIVPLYAEGYHRDASKFQLTVELTRWCFPYIAYMGLTAITMGVLQASGTFFWPAFAPALLNITMIVCALTLTKPLAALGIAPIYSLCVAVILGGVIQLHTQLPLLKRHGYRASLAVDWRDPALRDVIKRLSPLLIGLGVYQVNIMLTRLFASYLPDGSQSYLYYGQRLVEVPQGMMALAIAAATTPSLAKLRAQDRAGEAKTLLADALSITFFVSMPALVILIMFAEPIVNVLFGHGAFKHHHVIETARNLQWQAGGIAAVSLVRSLVPAFHAWDDTRSPVVSSAINLVVFVATALWLMPSMQHVALAAATMFASGAQLMTLLVLFRVKHGALPWGSLSTKCMRVLFTSACMAAAAYAASYTQLNDWVSIVLCTGVFIVVGLLINRPEFNALFAAVQRRQKKATHDPSA